MGPIMSILNEQISRRSGKMALQYDESGMCWKLDEI